MAQPLGGLEGPVGPEEPGDDACTGHRQGLGGDRGADQGPRTLVHEEGAKATKDSDDGRGR